MPRFNGKLSRTKALSLMKRMGLQPSTISGQARKNHSRRHLKTMDTISDPAEYFVRALITELEHGKVNKYTNITNDDLDATAKIVTAHLNGVEYKERPMGWKWFPAYFDYLWDMEKNGPK